MPAGDGQIVGKPSGVTRLPIDTPDSPQLGAESVRAGEDVQQKSSRYRILVMEPGPASQLDRRLLFCDVLRLLFQVACSFSDLGSSESSAWRRTPRGSFLQRPFGELMSPMM